MFALQDNEQLTDDGSLSVWSAQHQILYANIEVQDGHRCVQAEMIQLLHDLYFQNIELSVPSTSHLLFSPSPYDKD